jgi:hypothetical protein
MQGLQIQDTIRWHDKWSSEIGRRLKVKDITNDMFVFDEKHSREDILAVLKEVPEDLYQIFEVVENPSEEDCDYMADSGLCYRKIH